jgi:hypothetical protein
MAIITAASFWPDWLHLETSRSLLLPAEQIRTMDVVCLDAVVFMWRSVPKMEYEDLVEQDGQDFQ